MSGPSPALSALAQLRRVATDARARDVTRAEERLRRAMERQERAGDALARRRARLREQTASEERHIEAGKARVVDLLRQDRYLGRAEEELRRLDDALGDARRQVAAHRSELRAAREVCSAAEGGRRAVEGRLAEERRAAARRAERAGEEEEGEAFAARWRPS